MLLEEIKNIKSTKKELQSFGILICVVLGLVGAFWWWKGYGNFLFFFLGSFAFVILGLISPILLAPFYKVWIILSLFLSFIMTRVILSILFYFVITPIGLVSRIFHVKFLDLRVDANQKSYWDYREDKIFVRDDYEKQF